MSDAPVTDTIFALSSGRPPAAIAVMRISGPAVRDTARALTGVVPPPRTATLRRVRDHDNATLDQALILFFPGPNTATGEDLLELHLHGGRAVVAAVERALAALPGVRLAQPGEFTRRALEHGRIDLVQAAGIADLLEAETESQRRAAVAASEGTISRAVLEWIDRLSVIAARVEADIDFSDEADVADDAAYVPRDDITALARAMGQVLDLPSVERLRDGITVVLAGPRNAGKSSLFNALLDREAAIVTPIAGTTRDVIEASVIRHGIPYRLIDTAGLTEASVDPVERVGIDRAARMIDSADLILWFGAPQHAPARAIRLSGKSDISPVDPAADLPVSAHDIASVQTVWTMIEQRAGQYLGGDSDLALREEQRRLVAGCRDDLLIAAQQTDPLLIAEQLRVALGQLAALLGRDATEAMLDALFGRFCLGK